MDPENINNFTRERTRHRKIRQLWEELAGEETQL